MTNAIDNAITRLQDIAALLDTLPNGTIVHAESDYPTESAQPFPFSVAYLAGGSFRATNATIHHNFPVIAVEFHFSRANIKQAYQQIDAVAYEYPKRLVSDPTLNGTVKTIVFGQDSNIEYIIRPFEYGSIKSQLLRFDIPVKLLEAPKTST